LFSSQRGFSAMELLVIVVIVCVVVAVGVPVLHTKARVAVLDANMQSLGTTVEGFVVEGYSTKYQPGGGDPRTCLTARLETTLRLAGRGGYVNLVAGSKGGRAIVNSHSLPDDTTAPPPAVFITDAPECRYDSFSAMDEHTRSMLEGALIVAFNTSTRTIEVFSVSSDGHESATEVSIPM
jgi:hypothetical protein